MATSSIKRYKMDHQKRGYLIIIDNHTFPAPKKSLYGSERDVGNYKETFVFKLGFELVLRQNQTKNQMIKLMKSQPFSSIRVVADQLTISSKA